MHITNKSELNSGLHFVDTVTIEKQRNKGFYISNWHTGTKPFKQPFQEYVADNLNHLNSLGTFFTYEAFLCSMNYSKRHTDVLL